MSVYTVLITSHLPTETQIRSAVKKAGVLGHDRVHFRGKRSGTFLHSEEVPSSFVGPTAEERERLYGPSLTRPSLPPGTKRG
jgi:hypothetical protein